MADGVTRLLNVLVALLLVSGCASMPVAEKVAVGCAGFDLGTTAVGIEQGLQEMNPVMDDQPIIYGVAASVGLHYLFRALDMPKVAWWVYGGIRCSAGAYNLGEL